MNQMSVEFGFISFSTISFSELSSQRMSLVEELLLEKMKSMVADWWKVLPLRSFRILLDYQIVNELDEEELIHFAYRGKPTTAILSAIPDL